MCVFTYCDLIYFSVWISFRVFSLLLQILFFFLFFNLRTMFYSLSSCCSVQLICTNINMLMERDGCKASDLQGTNLGLGPRIRAARGPSGGASPGSSQDHTPLPPAVHAVSQWMFSSGTTQKHLMVFLSNMSSSDTSVLQPLHHVMGLFSANRFDRAAPHWWKESVWATWHFQIHHADVGLVSHNRSWRLSRE